MFYAILTVVSQAKKFFLFFWTLYQKNFMPIFLSRWISKVLFLGPELMKNVLCPLQNFVFYILLNESLWNDDFEKIHYEMKRNYEKCQLWNVVAMKKATM